MQQTSRNFHNYKVWQDAVTLATLVYDVTAKLPWFEKKVYVTNYNEPWLVSLLI